MLIPFVRGMPSKNPYAIALVPLPSLLAVGGGRVLAWLSTICADNGRALMFRITATVLLAAIGFFTGGFGTHGAEAQSVAEFYKGRIITIVVGFGPGC